MKRHHNNHEILTIELPVELLIEICSKDWSLSGPIARTCKLLLKEMIQKERLKSIVESALGRGWIYPWLLLSLGEEFLPQSPNRITDISTDKEEVFITGGALSQRVYGKEWEGDIDVWYEDGDDKDVYNHFIKLPDRRSLDIVKSRNHERCIERFDLSVVQQGYFITSGKSYCTPLALYSRMEKVIIAIPCRECIDYKSMGMVNRLVDIWYYINKHLYGHKDATIDNYHQCLMCSEDPSTGHEVFQRWRKRMRRYSERFPEYKIIYTRSIDPSIQNEINIRLDKPSEHRLIFIHKIIQKTFETL